MSEHLQLTIETDQTSPAQRQQCVDAAVIVPVYNRPQTVVEALDSVIAQTSLPRILVIVDDGSTDETPAVLSRWITVHRDAPVDMRMVYQPNAGVSASRNRGAALAEDCRYLAFLDSDDRWPVDFLQRMTELLGSCASAAAASCDRRFIDLHWDTSASEDLGAMADDPIAWMFQYGAGISSSTLLRAADFWRLGGFNETLQSGEDADLFLRLASTSGWLHAPGAPTEYRRNMQRRIGEEGNLSMKFDDNMRRWAEIFERFYCECRRSRTSLAPSCSVRLSQMWYRAGKELLARGRTCESRACFARAIRWRPLSAKAWSRFVSHLLPVLFRRESAAG